MNKNDILPENSDNQRGSILIYIFIAVALFGALSYTVASMVRDNNPELVADQRASLLADEILAYGEKLKQAVQTLRISNGCDPASISFENTSVAGYAHAPAVPDTCKVFHASGAGVAYIPPSSDFGTATNWGFIGNLSVTGLGTDCAAGDTCTELLTILDGLTAPVCHAINKKLGLVTASKVPPVQNNPVTFTQFTGSYTWDEDINDDANDDVLNGRPAGCTQSSDGASYFFYQTLIPR